MSSREYTPDALKKRSGKVEENSSNSLPGAVNVERWVRMVFWSAVLHCSRVEKVPYPGILDTNWEILRSWEIFRGKKKSRKERKKEKKGEKRDFLQFPHKFPNAKKFPKNFPMLKISL